jgi:hypothetical protein
MILEHLNQYRVGCYVGTNPPKGWAIISLIMKVLGWARPNSIRIKQSVIYLSSVSRSHITGAHGKGFESSPIKQ